jgi:hypothetical protein
MSADRTRPVKGNVMNTQTAIVVVVVALIFAGLIAALLITGQRRSRHLKNRFGPEYGREVDERGRRTAEKELVRREQRVEKLPIHPLPPTERARYAQLWNEQQARFVDDPRGAVDAADHLVEEVMARRGYPVGEFEQRAADISVDHPHVVENYRTAHDIARHRDLGSVATEDLRHAMVCYRALFDELLDDRLAQSA